MVRYVIRPAKISRKTVWRFSLAMLMSLSLWSPARWWKSVSLNPNTISFCFPLRPRVNRYWQPISRSKTAAHLCNKSVSFSPVYSKRPCLVLLLCVQDKNMSMFFVLSVFLRVFWGDLFSAQMCRRKRPQEAQSHAERRVWSDAQADSLGLGETPTSEQEIRKGYSDSLLAYGREISKSNLSLTRFLALSANTRFDFYSNNSDFNFSSSRSAIGVKIWYFFQIKYIFVSSFGMRGRKTSPLSGFVSIKCSKVKR